MINAKRLGIGLGLSQMIGFSSTYYIPAVLGEQAKADLGISTTLVMAGFTLGMLVCGGVSPYFGRWIEKFGGRGIAIAAPLVMGIGLVAAAFAHGPITWFLAWFPMGIGMAMFLYDTEFATIGRLLGNQARGAIIGVTLFGGFGTVSISVGTYLVAHIGWRDTLLVYALTEILLLVPLAMWAVPPLSAAAPPPQTAQTTTVAARPAPPPHAFFWLSIYVIGRNAINAAVFIHALTLLQGLGYSLTVAVTTAAAIGPAQVGARVFDLFIGRRFNPLHIAFVGSLLLPLGILGTLAGLPLALFAVTFGVSNGLFTVSRGTLPMHVYGPVGYATRMGRLARPGTLATAAAPTLFAPLVVHLPSSWVFVIVAIMGMIVSLSLAMLRERKPA